MVPAFAGPAFLVGGGQQSLRLLSVCRSPPVGGGLVIEVDDQGALLCDNPSDHGPEGNGGHLQGPELLLSLACSWSQFQQGASVTALEQGHPGGVIPPR